MQSSNRCLEQNDDDDDDNDNKKSYLSLSFDNFEENKELVRFDYSSYEEQMKVLK